MALPKITADDVEKALNEFDLKYRGLGEWAHWQDNKKHIYAISHGDKLYPVKQIVSLASKVPRSDFGGGIAPLDANQYVEDLGFIVEELRQLKLRAQWLEEFEALSKFGTDFARNLKSPQITYKGWRLGAEHQRNYRTIIIRRPTGTILKDCPVGWEECPPSDKSKNWDYRVQILPNEFKVFIQTLDIISLVLEMQVELIEREFEERVVKALTDSHEIRLARLANSREIPEKIRAYKTIFVRNADVVAEVLAQANGICGACGELAPFKRRSDGSPYLEVHHRHKLADGGRDTVENAIALCPNCHRRSHFG
jgi:hypothetical protein